MFPTAGFDLRGGIDLKLLIINALMCINIDRTLRGVIINAFIGDAQLIIGIVD